MLDPWDQPFNGTVVSTRRFVAAMAARGVRVRLLSLDGGLVPCERVAFEPLRIPGVNRIIDAMRSPLARPVRGRVREALRGCDVLHVQYPFFLGWVAVTEARRMGIPVVCSFHVQPENILGNLGLRGRWLTRLLYRLFDRGFFGRAERVIAPSEFAAGLLREHGVATPISVVSNGVPDTFLDAARPDAARPDAARPDATRPPRTDPHDSGFRLLSVGRLAREKQQSVLLEAVARSAHRESIRVSLVGAGPRQEPLTRLARRLGVRAEIGPASDQDLLKGYLGADLFVHCGGVELEGMSVLEAMATGNAVIVAAAPDSASGSLVEHHRASFPPGDAGELAARIDFWLGNPAERRAEGEANRRRAAAYRHARCVSDLMAVYAQVLDSRAGGDAPAARRGVS